MIIKSLLDTDLYKLTMGQVVWKDFPNARVKYTFTNRGNTKFPDGFVDVLRNELRHMSSLSLTRDERNWMEVQGVFLPTYIDWFSGYKYDDTEIVMFQENGVLTISIIGYWYKTIYWEVPLMALISELYFKLTNQKIASDSFERIIGKATKLQDAAGYWSDFGTRRRYSYEVQKEVVDRMRRYTKFLGTSNPHFAIKYGINAIGTSAHEATMAMQGIYGVRNCNAMWMKHWYEMYRGKLGIALTDTVTTDVFLKDFDGLLARIFDGVRHDSACPYEWGEKIINHYNKLKINPLDKTLVFSDGLTTDTYYDLAKYFHHRVGKVVGGIGTHLTNDVGVTPLNMVIKLAGIIPTNNDQDYIGVVKLSDTPGKHSGSQTAVANVKYQLGIV